MLRLILYFIFVPTIYAPVDCFCYSNDVESLRV